MLNSLNLLHIGGQSSSDALRTCSREIGIAVGVVILVVGIIAAVMHCYHSSHLLAGDEVYNIYMHNNYANILKLT